jgi:DNA-binding transcriptional ArsR family regulator
MEAAVRAIVEPRRREILRLIWTRELSAGRIAAHFAVTPPAISQHLRVLKDVGLVSERRDGTHRFYRARPETIAEVRRFLEAFWDEGLHRLKVEAEAQERRKRRRRSRK